MEALKEMAGAETNGREAGVDAPASLERAETVEEEPVVGPVLPQAEEAEDDPYNLPISHEVTLEGTSFLPHTNNSVHPEIRNMPS